MLLSGDELLLLLDLLLLLGQLHLLLLADLRVEHLLLQGPFSLTISSSISADRRLIGAAFVSVRHQHVSAILAVADLGTLLREPKRTRLRLCLMGSCLIV